MIKLAEGGYNKIFRLIMDDGKVAIARIPNPNAGPKFYTTASEVATMEFARTVLDIPTPRVYTWSAVDDNSVGSEYIIMEEAVGTQLENVWEGLTPPSKLEVMREIVKLEQKMLFVSFSQPFSYGSIYFASSAIKGSVPAEITSDTPVGLKDKVSETFTIGPSVGRGFWRGERSAMDIDRGPWSNAVDYVMSVGRREIAWIKRYAVAKAPSDPLVASTAQNDPEAHIQLLEKYLQVAPYLVEVDRELTESILWHDDLHGSNIFVDGNRITSVIDWQSIWAGPLLFRARPCPIIDYQGPVLLKRPHNFEDLDDERKVQIKAQIARSTLSQLYILESEKRNPKLAKAFNLEHGKTRRLAVEYSGDSWDDDIVSFRETLINVERYWKELGFKENCPIHFTEQDLKSHLQDAEGWNEVQDFFDHIDHLVKRDGWTSNEKYEDAVEFFSELRKIGLQNLTGSQREEFERETRWVDR
ncbi:hypothetical protein DTO164E3_6180 [Paecilomyces variotii]|nr:hypothetical protein DTO164E3_6180 [Paecilomyces variotii]KAJ9205178.1 hypothetical protein DTO032I3_2381 [Paecilomyces variotii]KAJ9280308.1 hypothetical protein DTO021D3_2896 [Paecilomyces variotii]KAJ9343122.1 hypothetical protein DTO027B6_4397 [Paecilomyces variotii]KAJ9359673.1 hypothetical protein DTO027B9_1721 [Paecilomyces variotii]